MATTTKKKATARKKSLVQAFQERQTREDAVVEVLKILDTLTTSEAREVLDTCDGVLYMR